MLLRIQQHWPSSDEYSEEEAVRLADLLGEWKWKIDDHNLTAWVRSHMRREVDPFKADWERGCEVTADPVPAKTCFQCGSGGGRRVIRKGMEMS